MLRNFTLLLVFVSTLGCTNLDERHVFNYKIEGSADHVDDVYVIMGPGLEWRANQKIELPLDISHDIYGTELDYLLEATHSDSTADVTLKVYIDGELIEEDSVFVYDSLSLTNRIRISGVFVD
ncbi:MAG: hypothetical protein CMP67_01335 [Flavobacteriales bacterium]|nr:hypothetical protein [Flavobacteriales bacterium]|tara:strand:- start:1103 stop:1471 length:369 start_codon:yes stop_codon:yes gene_type:complete